MSTAPGPADNANLPSPAVIAQEIVKDFQVALAQFMRIAGHLAVQVPEVAV